MEGLRAFTKDTLLPARRLYQQACPLLNIGAPLAFPPACECRKRMCLLILVRFLLSAVGCGGCPGQQRW
eukprot:1456788-Amphidinium_carterae.1